MRRVLLSLSFLTLAACTSELEIQESARSDHAERVVLEGEALTAELTGSPAREAPVPFARLGLLWDAPADTQLEFSFSDTGESWSEWQPATVVHVEAEATNSYVGTMEVEGGNFAMFYRVRAVGAEPSFVAVEFLENRLSEVVEDGETEAEGDPEEALGSEFGELSQELTFGTAYVNSRSAWGARAPRCRSSTSPYRFTIHHTVTPTNDSMSPQSRLRQIQSYHMNARGFCDIGYNFLISRDGRMWEGRGATTLGGHAGGANTGNLGISFMGTHTSTSATSTQINNVAALVKGLASRFKINVSSTTLKGHRQVGTTSTSCPGNALYRQLGSIITKARASTTTPKPSSGTTVKGLIYKGTNTSARISGATVKLGSRITKTSSTGFYQFTGVSSGTYTVTASKAGFKTKSEKVYASGKEVWASMGLAVATPPGGTVIGVIYRGTNTSARLPGATVKLGSRTTTANADGIYKFTSVPAGTYKITVSKSGYVTRTVTREISGSETWASVGLSVAQPAGTAVLQGVIYRGTNSANRVGGATVKLSNGKSTTADADGFYKFTKLAPGTYTISASKSGVGTGKVSRTISNGTVTWGSVSLR